MSGRNTTRAQPVYWKLALCALFLPLIMACDISGVVPDPTPALDPMIESFVAAPATIDSGGVTTLKWETVNADSVSINGVDDTLAGAGTTIVTPSMTTTYLLTATNAVGKAVTASVTVRVIAIVSLEVTQPTPLTSVGETIELSVTARMSDGSRHSVAGALVDWKSSDPWVATVEEGTATAAGGGNARITATYQGHKTIAFISVRISTQERHTVRVLYASPSDREFRADYSEGISHALVDLQSWYRRELGGLTFSLYQATPEWCQMSESEAFYASGDAWSRVLDGVQHCALVTHGASDFVWIIYVDVYEDCDEYPNHELGRGGSGITIVARWDLEGLTNPGEYYYCPEGPFQGPLGRWIGGMGHELAHGFGVHHPPGCDPWDPETCDDLETESLMHDGYSQYPFTYLLPEDKEILIDSPFIAQ